MNTTTTETAEKISQTLHLRLEEAPPFGSGTMPAAQERTFAMLAHLFPLIIWFWKRKESPVVDAHGKEALNFGITAMICLWPVSFLASFLGVTVARVVGLGMSVLGLGLLALVIWAMLKARDGKLLRYPVNFRLIK